MTPARATVPAATRTDELPRAAVGTLAVAWTTIIVLRVVYIRAYRFDTDEAQHLHVVWAWVRGLVQYRDVFDNHAPLFHLLFAPLAAAIGERSEILFYMRAATIPLSMAALWATYAIGRATFGRAVGAWAAVFTALVPGFFLASVEFRADALWTALWLLMLAALLTTPRHAFTVGLLLGATLCTSLKTVLFLLALAPAVVATVMRARAWGRGRIHGRDVALAAVGFAIPPAVIVLFFATRGALPAMIDATVTHNVLGGMAIEHWTAGRIAGIALAVPLWWWGGELAARSTADLALAARRRVLVLTALAYVILLEGCWPIATRQDVEPWVPLAVVIVTAVGFGALRHLDARVAWIARWATATAVIGGAVVLVQVTLLLAVTTPWRPRPAIEPALLADVLRLTRSSDTVMDLKGETVFRDRPFYYVLETLTRERMRGGFIADTIPEELIARGTCVAVLDSERLPPRARDFLLTNYLPVGRLRVAGRLLAPGSAARQTVTFEVRIPAAYAIVADGRDVRGWLDGRRYTGRVVLATGRHRLRIAPTTGPIALVWAPALERGFTPVVASGAA